MSADSDKILARLDEFQQATRQEIAELRDTVQEQNSTILQMQLELARYKGLAGGVMLVITCLWAAFLGFKDYILTGRKD